MVVTDGQSLVYSIHSADRVDRHSDKPARGVMHGQGDGSELKSASLDTAIDDWYVSEILAPGKSELRALSDSYLPAESG